MRLPMALRYEPMPDDRNLRAILYGPLVLAGGLGRTGLSESIEIGPEGPEMSKHPGPPVPQFQAASKQPADWITQDDAMSFRGGGVTFKPFYQVSRQRYSIYWRLT